jgi:hypothetical protein
LACLVFGLKPSFFRPSFSCLSMSELRHRGCCMCDTRSWEPEKENTSSRDLLRLVVVIDSRLHQRRHQQTSASFIYEGTWSVASSLRTWSSFKH